MAGTVRVVIDTNIVLDVFIFDDAAARELKQCLVRGGLHWIATQPMRDELERVLDYAHIVSRMAFYGLQAEDVLAGFDRHVTLVEVAAKASAVCRDPDDQKFIDLAVHHRCLLLSKDKAVLTMRKRLAALQVIAQPAMPASSYSPSAVEAGSSLG
ncbi:MAG TPA: putative toxin-antitoxin system toxin component, PIN family [Ramlibacter sp.]|nr:putative toxin-antitoxin system toxin component, PIN family [Ramlibacter sp.]